jgi:pimeloyl-ACP methyl ester carboxylesterase
MELHDDDLKNFEAHGAAALPVTDDQDYVDHEGARIWYATFGAGPTVIMLHGGLGHSGNWGYQVPALTSSGYRAVLIDSRGHGHSTRDERPYTYELMASDVLAVMDHLQLEKATFVGWSDGACTALVLGRNAAPRSAGVFFFACNMDPSGTKDIKPSPRPVFQASHQGLCPVVGHAGSIRALCRCSPSDAEYRTQLLCT